MGIFSGSKKQSSSTSTTNITQVENTSLEGNEGIAFTDAEGVRITTSDSGAIDAARSIAADALGFGAEALDFGRDSLDAINDVSGEALDLGRSAVSGAYSLAAQGFDNANEFGLRALDAIEGAYSDSLDQVAVLADRTSASSDSRVEGIAKEAVRALVIAVAAAIIVPLLVRKL